MRKHRKPFRWAKACRKVYLLLRSIWPKASVAYDLWSYATADNFGQMVGQQLVKGSYVMFFCQLWRHSWRRR